MGFPDAISDKYKKFRNCVAELAREDSLRVIWAYTQYLQLPDFIIPTDIEVDPRFYSKDVERAWINEWSLALLAKEVLLHSGAVAKKGASLSKWNVLGEFLGQINKIEGEIYGAFGSSNNILVELIRIAHRTFEWQGNGPSQRSIIRYYKIFNTHKISEICVRRYGLTIYEVLACGTAVLGHYLDSHSLRLPIASQIAQLPVEKFKAFLSFVADDISTIKPKLKSEQQYNEGFAYAFNSLRARPVVYMCSGATDVAVCPIPTLLFWRYTAGLYYDLITVPEFANLFGDSFQSYIGEVVRVAAPSLVAHEEQKYSIGSREKRTVDWIVSDGAKSSLFIECRAKRIRQAAKQALSDTAALEEELGVLASAVVQTYRTIKDCLDGYYPHFQIEAEAKVYPCVVTLEDWHMHGPKMYGLFRELVRAKMEDEGLPDAFITKMAYSIWPIDRFEIGLQLMDENPIAVFMDGKLLDAEMQDWEWGPYMSSKFKAARKSLFEKEYAELFADFRPV
jgi:hypothetical protein